MNSKTIFFNKYIIFLLAFFSKMIINVGGEISPTFIIILLSTPIWYKNISSNKLIQPFIRIFYIILTIQILWIAFAQTTLIIQIKAVLITLSGLLFFLFYYYIFINRPTLLKWHLLGIFTSSFFFINVLAEVEGSDFGFWKFQLYPRIVSLIILICICFSHKKSIYYSSPIILILLGTLGLTTGARSAGLSPFIAGIILLFVLYKKNLSIRKINKSIITTILMMYLTYALLYVPNVLNGTITSGNSEQLKQIENPYNPLNLLMMGRTDAIVPFIAFLDKPLTGWGYFTPDPNLKYRHLMSTLTNDVKTISENIFYLKDLPIPGHSVVGYYACSYGIIVFILLCIFIIRFSKFLLASLIFKDELVIYRVYIYIYILWNLLFSPISHFKTLPGEIAILIALSVYSIYKKKYIYYDKDKK